MKLHETQEWVEDRRRKRLQRNHGQNTVRDEIDEEDDSRRLTLMRYAAYRLHY